MQKTESSYDRYRQEQWTHFITQDELKRLLDAVIESPIRQLRGIVLTAILTGLSLYIILKLHADHISFTQSLIRIPGDETYDGRDIAATLPDQLVLSIKRNIKEHKSGYVFENEFTKDRFQSISHFWNEALRKARIESLDFDDLQYARKAYALIALKNVEMVEELLRYRSTRQMQDFHQALSEEDFLLGDTKE